MFRPRNLCPPSQKFPTSAKLLSYIGQKFPTSAKVSSSIGQKFPTSAKVLSSIGQWISNSAKLLSIISEVTNLRETFVLHRTEVPNLCKTFVHHLRRSQPPRNFCSPSARGSRPLGLVSVFIKLLAYFFYAKIQAFLCLILH